MQPLLEQLAEIWHWLQELMRLMCSQPILLPTGCCNSQTMPNGSLPTPNLQYLRHLQQIAAGCLQPIALLQAAFAVLNTLALGICNSWVEHHDGKVPRVVVGNGCNMLFIKFGSLLIASMAVAVAVHDLESKRVKLGISVNSSFSWPLQNNLLTGRFQIRF